LKILNTDVCIVGGGPAGMMMALLLAKQKVNVIVVERNANFDREFRGEVLQPRFVQMLEQLNLRTYIESFPHLKLKHGAVMKDSAQIGEFNFSAIDSKFPYAMWMPQPILLQALYQKCQEYPTFSMFFHTKVQRLLKEGERIKGVMTKDAQGEELEIQANITVGADGRFSTIRQLGGFELEYNFYENDLIWFTIPHPKGMDNTLRFYMSKPIYLVLPKYPDLMQIGVAFPKEKWKEIRNNGIEKFKGMLKDLNPLFHSFAEELQDFKTLTVLNSRVQNVKEWAKNGCLLIGDAAHCASPVGAMGVSLSVATAIVAADVIWKGLKKQDTTQEWLRQVQTIRTPEIRLFHRSQIRVEKLAIRYTAWMRVIGGTMIPLFINTKLAHFVQRKIFLMPKTLPIDSSFVFDN
jgi:2-polyprenyl-6-methoxyphenol hydroxylase-like FAD-dependent oxidoreductase